MSIAGTYGFSRTCGSRLSAVGLFDPISPARFGIGIQRDAGDHSRAVRASLENAVEPTGLRPPIDQCDRRDPVLPPADAFKMGYSAWYSPPSSWYEAVLRLGDS
ncbi:hypothetical protein NKH73_30960 [Mesorhizobium sp. M0938]|uniref:hypothetical protein n=1 Tax=unclassified Mesorhizobium TaxID=325217 RepID=UPI00333619E5